MALDPRVASRYDAYDEDDRLWKVGYGDLIRLRTWDIFARYLPSGGRLVDVGGGPGTHAAHLAGVGYEVTLVEPIARHFVAAAARSGANPEQSFRVVAAEARQLPVADGSADIVLLMGPLYHLMDAADRQRALQEAMRVLRPGGRLLAEAISRYAWVLDATARDLLGTHGIWDNFAWNLQGLSQDPDDSRTGEFWAYFHLPDELHREVEDAGLVDIELTAVEGFGRLLGELETRMTKPDGLLRAIRLLEHEPSLLGVSAHIVVTATRP
jgi:SAM-dependent methyltransferase